MQAAKRVGNKRVRNKGRPKRTQETQRLRENQKGTGTPGHMRNNCRTGQQAQEMKTDKQREKEKHRLQHAANSGEQNKSWKKTKTGKDVTRR